MSSGWVSWASCKLCVYMCGLLCPACRHGPLHHADAVAHQADAGGAAGQPGHPGAAAGGRSPPAVPGACAGMHACLLQLHAVRSTGLKRACISGRCVGSVWSLRGDACALRLWPVPARWTLSPHKPHTVCAVSSPHSPPIEPNPETRVRACCPPHSPTLLSHPPPHHPPTHPPTMAQFPWHLKEPTAFFRGSGFCPNNHPKHSP